MFLESSVSGNRNLFSLMFCFLCGNFLKIPENCLKNTTLLTGRTSTFNLHALTHQPKHLHQPKNGPTPRLKWISHTNNKAPQPLSWKKGKKIKSVHNNSTTTIAKVPATSTHHGRRTGNDWDVRLDTQSRLGQTSTRNEPQKNCTNTSKRGCRHDKKETEFPKFPKFPE